MTIDPQAFKQTLAHWASGVTILTTVHNGQRHGMTASSFSSLSIDPLLITVAIGKKLHTHELIRQSGIFAVNILNHRQLELGRIFAGMIPEITDRFQGIDVEKAVTGAPILPDVVGWLDCEVYTTYEGGDHTIFVGEAVAASSRSDMQPMLYYNRQWGTFEPLQRKPMLTHIVMFKLHKPTPENISAIRHALIALPPSIRQIRHLEIGANVVQSDRAYDLALTVTFDSLEDMQAYQVHPDHQRVVNEIIKPLTSSIIAVDYES